MAFQAIKGLFEYDQDIKANLHSSGQIAYLLLAYLSLTARNLVGVQNPVQVL